MIDPNSQLIEALREATGGEDGDDGFRTREELQEVLGWHRERVLGALKALQRAGKLEVKSIHRTDISGRRGVRPGYRMATEEEGE